MAQLKWHAHRIEPTEPRAQQRRCLEGFRKNAPAGADEGRLPQRLAPGTQGIRRECRDRSFKLRHRCAIAPEKFGQRLAVGQVEPATPRHQKLAARRCPPRLFSRYLPRSPPRERLAYGGLPWA